MVLGSRLTSELKTQSFPVEIAIQWLHQMAPRLHILAAQTLRKRRTRRNLKPVLWQAPPKTAKMESNAALKRQRKAASYLEQKRAILRLRCRLKGIHKQIPEPGEEMERARDPDATNSDSEDTGNGHMDGSEDTQPRFYNIPPAIASQLSLEQHAMQNFDFIHTTPEDIELAEKVQNERDVQEEEELMEGIEQTHLGEQSPETYTYPDPRDSEMVPPPTPRLSHAELPLPSIEIDVPDNTTNETRDVVMEESDDEDLSDITHLLRDHAELPRPSIELEESNNATDQSKDTAMQDSDDGDLSNVPDNELSLISFETETPVKATDETSDEVTEESVDACLSNIIRTMRDQPWWSEVQDWVLNKRWPSLLRVGDDFDLPDPNSKRQLEVASRISSSAHCSRSPQRNSNLREHVRIWRSGQCLKDCWLSNPDRKQIASLASVTIHQDGSIESETLPEQSPAAEPASPKPTETAKPDFVLHPALEYIRGYTKSLEAEAQTTRAEDEKTHVLCRAHGAPLSEHVHGSNLCYLPGMRGYVYPNPASERCRRRFSQQEVHSYKCSRFFDPPWKKFVVWQRSLLAKETRLMPTQNDRGEQRTWTLFHEGAGVTGGDPDHLGFKHCNQCEGLCEGR